MCGIVAAVSLQKSSEVLPLIVQGLKRLEYRGYDSCGLAYLQEGGEGGYQLQRIRSTGRVADLGAQAKSAVPTHLAIGHTRWATHGKPSTANSHPLFSADRIALVHNGIIENYLPLRVALQAKGFEFHSETDTEVIAHLIHDEVKKGGPLLAAVERSVRQLKGAYAIAVIDRAEPGTVVGARAGSPLVVGYGDNAHYLASDVMAIAGKAESFAYLSEGDVVEVKANVVRIFAANGQGGFEQVERKRQVAQAFSGEVDLGPYRHFMQKEIFEQPRAFADSLGDIGDISSALFGEVAKEVFPRVKAVHIIACGTSYYAGLVAQYWIESWAGIPVKVEIASEFRYRRPVLVDGCLLVSISQSGETADTLSAMRYAKELAAVSATTLFDLAICNVATSALVRESSMTFITRAGVEIGVASTKAFTTQLLALYLLSQALSRQPSANALQELRHLPAAASAVLALEPAIIAWAEHFAQHHNALFLGRGMHYPIALEGALKLKEISYIHAEGYPAGELKHGPLALVTEEMPVVVVAPNDELLEKLQGNMQEVRARGGQLFVFADGDSELAADSSVRVIRLPEHYGDLSPILHTLALQLLAYHTALLRGADIDKPRNLAKSVTVE